MPLGTEPVWAPLDQWGVNTYGTTLIANDTFAQDHPDLVKGFVDAYAKGIKWAEENPDAAVAMMQKAYPDADPAGLEKRVRAALTYFLNDYSATNGVGAIDPDRWQTGMQRPGQDHWPDQHRSDRRPGRKRLVPAEPAGHRITRRQHDGVTNAAASTAPLAAGPVVHGVGGDTACRGARAGNRFGRDRRRLRLHQLSR